MHLTPRFVAQALGLPHTVSAGADQPFAAVVTDSRKIVKDCLFVALKGDKFDGHDFIEGSIRQGARAILCRRDLLGGLNKVFPQTDFFTVPDSQEGFRTLSGAWRRQFQIPLIVIAGANGKTTTKELLAAILTGKFTQVLKTAGSQNGYLGIPMTLLELRPTHGAAVVEVGIDEIGAMHQHLELVDPTASLVTVIGPEHLEKLQDLATVAREEGLALKHVAAKGGIVALNLDDPWLEPYAKALTSGRKVGYSLTQTAGNGLNEIITGTLTDHDTSLMLNGGGLSQLSLKLPLLGKHNATNLLAAVTMARALGLSSEEIRNGLNTFKGPEGRSELRMLAVNTPVICDYYNASPLSMDVGLDLLDQIASRKNSQKRVRWACLADMLELGSNEETFHRGLADKLCALKIENILLYGPRMQWLLNELQNRGFQGNFRHFSSHSDLTGALTKDLKSEDVVLIKGSHSMRMEEVWKLLNVYAQKTWHK